MSAASYRNTLGRSPSESVLEPYSESDPFQIKMKWSAGSMGSSVKPVGNSRRPVSRAQVVQVSCRAGHQAGRVVHRHPAISRGFRSRIERHLPIDRHLVVLSSSTDRSESQIDPTLSHATRIFVNNGYEYQLAVPSQLTDCILVAIHVPMRSARSKRVRKRHIQQALFRRGGTRRGAGRKPKGARAAERHAARPEFKPYHALAW